MPSEGKEPGEVNTLRYPVTSTDLPNHLRDAYALDEDFANPPQEYALHDGVFFKGRRIVIPNDDEVRALLLREHHSPVMSGHFGVALTWDGLQRQFWWPEMRNDIRRFVRGCYDCQLHEAHQPTAGRTLEAFAYPGPPLAAHCDGLPSPSTALQRQRLSPGRGGSNDQDGAPDSLPLRDEHRGHHPPLLSIHPSRPRDPALHHLGPRPKIHWRGLANGTRPSRDQSTLFDIPFEALFFQCPAGCLKIVVFFANLLSASCIFVFGLYFGERY